MGLNNPSFGGAGSQRFADGSDYRGGPSDYRGGRSDYRGGPEYRGDAYPQRESRGPVGFRRMPQDVGQRPPAGRGGQQNNRGGVPGMQFLISSIPIFLDSELVVPC